MSIGPTPSPPRASHALAPLACTLLLACVAPTATVSARPCDEAQWTHLTPATTPPGRWFAAMAYDSGRQRVVMFGGQTPGGYIADTWEFDGADWSLRSAAGPAPRYVHAMAFDSARGVTVLYGGNAGAILDDTWEWDGATWTQVITPGPGREPSGMVFDSSRNVVVLFAGSETWEYDGLAWTARATSGPDQRFGTAMAFDAARHRTVLFGGNGGPNYNFDDTWEWNGDAWNRVFAAGPSMRFYHAMAFDPLRRRTVLFGGIIGRAFWTRLSDTWEFDGAAWTLTAPSSAGPSPRGGMCMAFDAARSQVVLFGGEVSYDDTWTYTVGPVGPDPSITSQPMGDSIPFHASVTLTVAASGGGVLAYQWRKDGTALSDNGHISGAATPAMTISAATLSDSGSYDVIVSNQCALVTSDAAVLSVSACSADFNQDDALDSQDLFDFLTAFFTSDPSADFDHSGTIESNDFFAFLAAFFSGCA